jgi:hypothetical protein
VNGAKAAQTRRTFSLVCTVEVNIRASAEAIWSLLTDAEGFLRWKSTVTRIEGRIGEGERIPPGETAEGHDVDYPLPPGPRAAGSADPPVPGVRRSEVGASQNVHLAEPSRGWRRA